MTEMNSSMKQKQTHQFSSVQSLNRVWLFVAPWTAACQASLSITNPQSLLKLMSIVLVMPSNHLILCHPFLRLPSIFPSIRVFSNEAVLPIMRPKYWSFSIKLPMNIQDWFPLGLTGLISLQSKGLSSVFSNTTVQIDRCSIHVLLFCCFIFCFITAGSGLCNNSKQS